MAWLRFDAIRRALDAVAPESVLEVGCGEGAMGAWFAARVAAYTGVEPDAVARATATARVGEMPGARIVASIDDTAGLAVDLACAFEVLEHVEDDVGLLDTLRSRVRPGGALLLSVPAHPDRYGASDELVGHHRRYARADLESRLTRRGVRRRRRRVVRHRRRPRAGSACRTRSRPGSCAPARRAAGGRDADLGPRTVGTPASGRYLQPGFGRPRRSRVPRSPHRSAWPSTRSARPTPASGSSSWPAPVGRRDDRGRTSPASSS